MKYTMLVTLFCLLSCQYTYAAADSLPPLDGDVAPIHKDDLIASAQSHSVRSDEYTKKSNHNTKLLLASDEEGEHSKSDELLKNCENSHNKKTLAY